MLIFTIAIISLVGYVGGILGDLVIESRQLPSARLSLGAIVVISWWEISFPLAIVIICVAAIWGIISAIAHS